MRDLFGLAGHGALIAGAGPGIGQETALFLAECGCDLVLVDIDAARAEETAAKIRALGRRAEIIVHDLVGDPDPSAIIHQALQLLPTVDRLVTVISAASWAPLLEIRRDAFDADIALNLGYVFSLCRAFAARLATNERAGAIVCIASASGVQAAPQHAAYGAAKAGLIHLVKTMGAEWARHGLRVNAVAPGSVVTPRRPEAPDREARIQASHVPFKRRGLAKDVAGATLFLLSDLAGYVTGQTLAVDGGWTAASILVDVEIPDAPG